MSDGTKIEWTDATWNVVNGCTVISPGCANCYAMRLAATRLKHHPSRAGLARMHGDTPQWTGEVRFNEKVLLDPLRWRRPRKIFVCAHGDLFHDAVPDEWIDKVFAVMALAPQHVFQVLTKRPERMRTYLADPKRPAVISNETWRRALSGSGGTGGKSSLSLLPLPNVWLGVSVEDQERADQRIPILLDSPAAVRWLSCEPLLGPVELDDFLSAGLHRSHLDNSVDWVVAGGESGPGARPMHPDWARALRDECAAAGVPFLFKQWGEFAPGEVAGDYLDPEKRAKGVELWDGRWGECWSEPDGHRDDEPDLYHIGKKRAGRLLDGVQHDGYPA